MFSLSLSTACCCSVLLSHSLYIPCCCLSSCSCFSVLIFGCSCCPVFLFFCSCFQIFLFSILPIFSIPVSLFLFSDGSVFQCSCFPLPYFSCSCFQCLASLFPLSVFLFLSALFLCSCFQMFLFSSVVFLFLFSDVPVFHCSLFPVFLFSSVPVFQCSCFSVPAVLTLRPVGLGCVDGTKTVASWSYLWEKTGYSLVHSDIQVCTYHTRQN